MYSDQDYQLNQKNRKREWMRLLLAMLPFAAMLVAGFVLRVEWLAIVGCVLMCSAGLFVWDMWCAPVMRYSRYLEEIRTGLSRETVGALVRIGSDPVYTDGVYFYELIINVYEDMSEEGERRFLLDCRKEVDAGLVGKDIAITSHGSYVLGVEAV